MIAGALVGAALPWVACNGTSSGGAGNAGGSVAQTATFSASIGATSSVGGTTVSGTSGGGGAGGASPCLDILPSDPCNDCLMTKCCTKLAACAQDQSCWSCITETDSGMLSCAVSACAVACAPSPPSCNPVTNAGCAAGAACDYADDANKKVTFGCFAPPPQNTAAICAACDDQTTACAGGSTCLVAQGATTGACAKFCCDDGDCGSGVCQQGATLFGVGVCVTAASADAGKPAPACDAPVVSPSMGSCVTLTFDGGAPPLDAGGD
jgi:hypothetical protein